ncbi:MAG: prepilin peptidase [Anaerolineae bacterium]|nr:prepilin peptidase [Anaerolineae bacterium]
MVIVAVLAALVVGAGSSLLAEVIMARRVGVKPQCPYCQEPYSPVRWSAVLALLTGRRACERCGQPLRWQRLAGEVFLMVLWGVLAARYGLIWRVALTMLAGVPLAMVLVTDLETRLIPNRIMLPAIVAMAVLGSLMGPAVPGIGTWTWWQSLAGGAVGLGVFGVLVMLGTLVWGEGALGQGDVKLATYIGLVVGFPLIIEALVLTFVGGFVGAVLLLLSRKGSLRSFFPYGPFLVLGAAATMLCGIEIVLWYWG